MIDKKSLIQTVDNITNILLTHDLADTICIESDRIKSSINEYAFRVLMIGGFSSGKSAFLNALMGRELLKENQAPETTIATELLYDSNEFIEAFDCNGASIRFALSDTPSVPPSEWRHLVYHVDCPFLKDNPDIILVDMPGIDSNIEFHNKAISQYISKGSAYILLVSCEDGTLKKSTSDFLQEITQYPQSLSCFVSKADLKPADELKQICAQVESEIAGIYSDHISVSPISVFDSDFSFKVSNQISQFDIQHLFEQKFASEINALISLGKSVLQAASDAQTLDCSSLDRRIKELTANRDELKRKIDCEKKQIEKKYSQQVIPAILMDLERALSARVDQLTSALTVSSEAFNASVNSIIRTVLYTSTEQHIENSFDEFVNQFDLSFLDENNDEFKEAILEGLHLISTYINQVKDCNNLGEDEKKRDSLGRTFQGFAATIAITTDFINPLIELAIVFLPTIMNIISGINRQSQYDDLKQKVQMVVIPEIVSKLSPQISAAVCETRDAMIAEVEKKMENIISTQEATLKKCLDEKEKAKNDFCDNKEKLISDMKTLDTYRM